MNSSQINLKTCSEQNFTMGRHVFDQWCELQPLLFTHARQQEKAQLVIKEGLEKNPFSSISFPRTFIQHFKIFRHRHLVSVQNPTFLPKLSVAISSNSLLQKLTWLRCKLGNPSKGVLAHQSASRVALKIICCFSYFVIKHLMQLYFLVCLSFFHDLLFLHGLSTTQQELSNVLV